ncbi:hypothetical protein DFH08DRAFT_370452 [Mycena albidolilacea]|uniref:Uncharacterized protein n=1 Tax=Mycena albidolilacea TaxID=1033008 RepID=A0AAD7AKZ7_9AGAR|nr:hypothetical protein DFH08DRAFT_370452 [Mycena albidolilacea]
MAFYNLVNAGIGPAQGIEESAGTYKAHMERLYCNQSYPAPPPSRQYYDDPCYSTTPEVTRPPTTIEKENINPLLSASHVVDNSQPSNNRYYRQTALPSSPLRRRIPHYTPVSPRREYLPAPSLPASTTHAVRPFGVSNNTSNIAILPATDLMPHERPAPLIWMSPVKYSASASSSQIRTQQWQAQVLARSNPPVISTFYR